MRSSITDVQAYWDRRPCNIRHSTLPIGTRAYFDEVEARKYFIEPHIPRFAQFPRWEGKRVLEIGCGIGTDTINFARHGANVTAVDLSPASLALARTRAHIYGLEDRIQFINANAEELSKVLPVEPYDLVYSFGVLHHTPNPGRAVAELRKYLAPDGNFKIMVYHRHAWKVLWILLTYGHGQFWQLPELVARYSEAETGCPVTFTYTAREARHLIEDRGFRVRNVEIDHIFPYRISDYIQYRYVREWYFQGMPKSLFRRLEHAFGWHLCVTAEAI